MKIASDTRLLNIEYSKVHFKPGDTHILYDKIKEGKQNIYFVSTPGQLLSAIEAQNHFQTKNNVLVILLFVIGDGKNIDHMFKLSEYFPYDRFITYQNKSAKYHISFIPFLKSLNIRTYNYMFFGFNTILYRRLVANILCKKLFYLDDGVHTITTHEVVYGKSEISPEYKPFPKTLDLLKMAFVYGMKNLRVDSSLNKLNFFTVYNLEQYKDETIVKHSYTHVRSLFNLSDVKSKTVYLLGQPLTNIGFSQETYDNYLNYIFEYYKDKKILFSPHRLEKTSKLILEKIKISENIDLLNPNMPIELYFLKNSIYPYATVSFITSALFNIAKLYPKTITQAFEVNTNNLDSLQAKGIKYIYNHYRKENIEIVPMQIAENSDSLVTLAYTKLV